MNYIFSHEDKQYTPDGQTRVPDISEHNAQLTRMELAAWALCPDRYCGYVTFDPRPITSGTCYYGPKPCIGAPVTLKTWTGEVLGSGRVSGISRNNLTGSRTVAIRIRGTNGATYHGRFGDEWSQLCRIRKSKAGR